MLEINRFYSQAIRLSPIMPILLFLFGPQALGSEALYTTSKIEVRWDAPGVISAFDLGRYRARGREIGEFYEKSVLPSVPASVWNGRTPPFISVVFRADLPTDGGLFVPPILSKKEPSTTTRKPAESIVSLTLQIHSSLILSNDSERTLTHEYFHAVHWIIHPNEPAWLKEGLAQLFETRVFSEGKFNTNHLSAGFSSPSTSLTGEIQANAISAAHYGHLLMYFWYLYQHCGGEDIFWKMAAPKGETFGSASIESALRDLKVTKKGCTHFSGSVAEFELARAFNIKTMDGTDPDRWFLLHSSLANLKFEKSLPNQAEWTNAGPWTPFFISADPALMDVKSYDGARVWWLLPGSNAQAVETRKRPSPRYTKILILKK